MVSQLRTGANLVVSQIPEIGNLYNMQKREINRSRYLKMMDLPLTCVPLRSSIWSLKLILTQLPAINDSENLILESSYLYWNPKNLISTMLQIICRENYPTLLSKTITASNCKLKTIKSPLTCWRGYK